MKQIKFKYLALQALLLISCSKKKGTFPDPAAILHSDMKGTWQIVSLELTENNELQKTANKYDSRKNSYVYYKTAVESGSVIIDENTILTKDLSYKITGSYHWVFLGDNYYAEGDDILNIPVDNYNGTVNYSVVNGKMIALGKGQLPGTLEGIVPIEGETAVSWSYDTLIINLYSNFDARTNANDTVYNRRTFVTMVQKLLKQR